MLSCPDLQQKAGAMMDRPHAPLTYLTKDNGNPTADAARKAQRPPPMLCTDAHACASLLSRGFRGCPQARALVRTVAGAVKAVTPAPPRAMRAPRYAPHLALRLIRPRSGATPPCATQAPQLPGSPLQGERRFPPILEEGSAGTYTAADGGENAPSGVQRRELKPDPQGQRGGGTANGVAGQLHDDPSAVIMQKRGAVSQAPPVMAGRGVWETRGWESRWGWHVVSV